MNDLTHDPESTRREYTLDLSLRNVTEGYVDSILLIAQVLREEGEWNWDQQRRLDVDVVDLRGNSIDDDPEVILTEWVNRVSHTGWDASTEEGIFTLTKTTEVPR